MNNPAVAVAPGTRDRSAHLPPTGWPSPPNTAAAGQPADPSASDLLAQRALVAATAAPAVADMSKAASGMSRASGAASVEASPVVDPHAALAATTRAAQRDVRTLVEALTQATASLSQPPRPPRH
jgi:hypothetical protein